jgi:hypothetical protein
METNHPLNATQTWVIAPGRSEIPWLTGLLVISLAVHVGAVVSIGKRHVDPPRKVRAPTLVTMTIEPAKPAPSTAAAQQGSGAAERVAPRRAAARPAKVAVAAPATAAEPQAETPADCAGATGGGGPGPKSEGPPILSLADLSKPPRAPVLSEMLERNYPDEARKRGVPGKAVMRLRVMPDGHLRDLIVVAESGGGFGEACKRTLRDSLWSPPLDLEARPVSTFVSYTCTFEVH